MAKHTLTEGSAAMWYVMQVVSGQENRTVLLLERMVSDRSLQHCFVPVRRLRKKFHGAWNEVTEKLFPGYIFLATEKPQLLYEELKHVPALTKILGKCEEYFTPLSGKDVETLREMQGERAEEEKEIRDGKNRHREGLTVGISKVSVDSVNQVKILCGPLKNMEGKIKKMNLHKRIAEVEMEFMGSMRLVYMGIEIVKENEECR